MNHRVDKSFFGELTRRKVTRVAVVYALVAWLAMQVGETTFEALSLPPWSLTLLIVLLAIAFPIALVIAWAYEVTPTGIRRDRSGKWFRAKNGPVQGWRSRPSIAVLPFYDISEHSDQGHVCEGLADEILNALCKIEGLEVASRVSSFQLGREGRDIVEIGRKLRVRSILEGTVRKYGDRIRITVELLKTSDGYHLWSRRYDRRLEDLLDIEEDVAYSVARLFRLSTKEVERRGNTVCNPEAFDFLLRGNSYFAGHALQDIKRARTMFLKALELDPDYGRAWAGLASTYGFEYMHYEASEINLQEAQRASERAVELMPERAESHVLWGIANCMARNYGAAAEAYERALQLNPRSYEAYYYYARVKVREGAYRGAIELFQKAAEIRPNEYECLLLQAQLWVSLGDERKAVAVSREGIARARRALELNPNDNRALNLGAFALLRLGEVRTAEEWLEQSLSNAPDDTVTQYNVACFYALRGRTEMALDALEKCVARIGNTHPDWLAHDSDLDSIRHHPRFRAMESASANPPPTHGHSSQVRAG